MASPKFESAAEWKLKTVVVEDVYQDRPKPSALDIWVQQGGYSAWPNGVPHSDLYRIYEKFRL